MPQEIIESPPFSRVAAWLFRLSGVLPQARSHLEAYIRQVPSDLSMRLLWLDVVERQGDDAAIQSFLSGKLPYLKQGSGTRDIMALAQAMARRGLPERGLDLGYRVLRERWSKAKAHLGFFGLMMMVEEVRGAIPSPTSIAPGVAFTVEDDLGHRRVSTQPEGRAQRDRSEFAACQVCTRPDGRRHHQGQRQRSRAGGANSRTRP